MRTDSLTSTQNGTQGISAPKPIEKDSFTYPHPIVGIGASAGGLEALRTFLHCTAHLEGVSYVVVLHLDPNRRSLIVELLQKETTLRVREARDGEILQPDHVYVIPPNAVLTVHHGKFSVSTPKLPRGFRDPVNSLFASLAAELETKALGLVLSGTGTDGAHGAEAIKKHGGSVFIQDLEEAAFNGMPSSVAALGLADEMATLIGLGVKVELWLSAVWKKGGGPAADPQSLLKTSPYNIERIISILKDQEKQDFSNYRRGTVIRRVKSRVEKCGTASLETYIKELGESQDERRRLIDELLINVTAFFRDPESFQYLREKVFPHLLEQLDSSSRHLRVWVPACATGEEAYSLAIIFFEEMEKLKRNLRIHIFATDVDEEALEKARDGFYTPEALANVSREQLESFFIKTDKGYRVSRKLRDVIVFAKQNLLTDAPLPKMLLVSCRNVLIYFDKSVQQRLLNSSFAFSLNPSGYLFLGSTESTPSDGKRWRPVSAAHRIFQCVSDSKDLPPPPFKGSFGSRRERNVSLPVSPEQALTTRLNGLQAKQRIYEEILQEVSPPLFVVDSDNRVSFASARAKVLLRLGTGIVETKLESIIHPDVRWELIELLRNLRKSKAPSAVMKSVRILVDNRTDYYDFEAIRLKGVSNGDYSIAVTALPSRVAENSHSTAEEVVGNRQDLEREIKKLKDELQRLRTSQATAIVELESLNSELVISNQEYGTLNEELQAATEELETNKEELQSINEELQSVNAELTLKVKQLSDSNDDLYNLLSCNEFSPVLLIDADLCLKRFTVQAGELLFVRESDLGRRISELKGFLPEGTVALCKQVLQSRTPAETEIHTSKGKWFTVRVVPYAGAESGVPGLAIVLNDITEIKSYREALSRFQGRSKALVDSLPGNLFLCDEKGVIQYCKASRSAFQLFDPVTATGKSLVDLVFKEFNITPESMERIASLAHETFQDKQERKHELVVQIPRGPSLWFDVQIVACGTEGVLIFLHEITDRKLLELDMNRAVEAAELSNRAKTDFIANVSHELRTPLNSVIGFAQLLLRNKQRIEPATADDYIRRIEESGRILLHLVNELLDLAQLDSGKLELNMTKVNVAELVRNCVSLMAHQFGEKEQVCSTDLPVAPLDIFADEKRLKQVIINILSNAAKFSPPQSRVRISMEVTRQDSLGIHISDSGPGVPEDKLHVIFDRFVRHAEMGSAPQVGAGLGLAISKSIVLAHGGTVRASLPGLDGKGMTISILLPMRTV